MTILEMIEKRNQAIEAARNFAAAHKNDKGVLSDEDYALYEQMEKDIQDISREISRMQREDALEQELAKPINTPLTSKPFKGEIGGTGRSSEEYRKAMLGAFFVRVRMQTAATLCRRNTIRESLMCLTARTSCVHSALR